MSDKEHDDWDNLLKSDGWLRLTEFARQEWQVKLTDLLRKAANNSDDIAALHQIRQVIVAKDAIERLLAYPGERARQLTEKVYAAGLQGSLSRGGWQ